MQFLQHSTTFWHSYNCNVGVRVLSAWRAKRGSAGAHRLCFVAIPLLGGQGSGKARHRGALLGHELL